jgi:hypothetical protein
MPTRVVDLYIFDRPTFRNAYPDFALATDASIAKKLRILALKSTSDIGTIPKDRGDRERGERGDVPYRHHRIFGVVTGVGTALDALPSEVRSPKRDFARRRNFGRYDVWNRESLESLERGVRLVHRRRGRRRRRLHLLGDLHHGHFILD